jgi:hypothetical protein
LQPSLLNLDDPALTLPLSQHDHRASYRIDHGDLRALIVKAPIIDIEPSLLDEAASLSLGCREACRHGELNSAHSSF